MSVLLTTEKLLVKQPHPQQGFFRPIASCSRPRRYRRRSGSYYSTVTPRRHAFSTITSNARIGGGGEALQRFASAWGNVAQWIARDPPHAPPCKPRGLERTYMKDLVRVDRVITRILHYIYLVCRYMPVQDIRPFPREKLWYLFYIFVATTGEALKDSLGKREL